MINSDEDKLDKDKLSEFRSGANWMLNEVIAYLSSSNMGGPEWAEKLESKLRNRI